VARSVTVICATTTPSPGTHGLGVVPTVMSRLLEPAWLGPKHKGSSAGWPNVKLPCRLDTAGGGSYSPPCYIARLRKIQTEKAAASPRSNGSSPRPPRGGIYHIRASSGNRRTRDWEVSLAPVSAVCRSLPVAHKRQGCSEYRAYRETTPERPRNTGPLGKSCIQTRRETDGLNSNELQIPTLLGKNTDPTGKYETFDRRQRTLRCRHWWHIYRLTAVFRGKVRAVRRRLPVTDPMGKDYRSSWVSFTDPMGKDYRSSRVSLPTVAG
jgi:hypothetical protein